MAKYRFKWWHGLLGLMGLSMVLGTVRTVTGSRPQYTIRVVLDDPGAYDMLYRWEVLDAAGTVVANGTHWSESIAWSNAEEAVARLQRQGQLQ
jgi:hypothetical protein